MCIPTCVYVEECGRATLMNAAHWAPPAKVIGARPGVIVASEGAQFCGCVSCEPQTLLWFQYAMDLRKVGTKHFPCPCPECIARRLLEPEK